MVAGTDSLAHERAIETGIREGDKVQVLKGLKQDEQVIVVGGLGLEDKAKIHVEKPGEKADEKTTTRRATKKPTIRLTRKPTRRPNQHDGK